MQSRALQPCFGSPRSLPDAGDAKRERRTATGPGVAPQAMAAWVVAIGNDDASTIEAGNAQTCTVEVDRVLVQELPTAGFSRVPVSCQRRATSRQRTLTSQQPSAKPGCDSSSFSQLMLRFINRCSATVAIRSNSISRQFVSRCPARINPTLSSLRASRL